MISSSIKLKIGTAPRFITTVQKRFLTAAQIIWGEINNETATKNPDMSFAAGTQGVGMQLEITTLPTDVSFYNVEVIEIDQGTQNITGFFVPFPANALAHNPNLNWTRLDQANQWNDSAGFDGWGSPNTWAYGTYEWAIEVRWRVFNKGHFQKLPLCGLIV